MQLVPQDLSGKTPNETRHIKIKLAAALPTDAVLNSAWSSDPSGLTFANPTITEAGKSVEVDISGGSSPQTYAIKALVTTAAGQVLEPWVRMPVQNAGV